MKDSSIIEKVLCRRVFDSRGNPTIEVDIITKGGVSGRAICPSGSSTGNNEALEIRDNDDRYNGKDIKRGLDLINNKISKLIVGISCEDQSKFDQILKEFDSSDQKKIIGGNVSTSLSIANYLCASNLNNIAAYNFHAKSKNLKIPKPEIQIFGGGAHSGIQNSFQDFLIYPIDNFNYEEFLHNVHQILNHIKDTLIKSNNFFGYCDEGGFFPNKINQFDICEIINESILKNKLTPGKDLGISIDVAATNFYRENTYNLYNKIISKIDLSNILEKLIKEFNVNLIEDPFHDEDFESFSSFKVKNNTSVKIIGDDLTCSSLNLLNRAIKKNCIDGIIIKINQCGTISEALETIEMAKNNNIKTILSARSGDTEEVFLSHLAVAWDVDMIKVGSLSRSERTSKWNELVRIEEKLK
tara:strand:- start:203 stop:1441 length:1239 start_codon:yes stop_codon:yes gene_type:complete